MRRSGIRQCGFPGPYQSRSLIQRFKEVQTPDGRLFWGDRPGDWIVTGMDLMPQIFFKGEHFYATVFDSAADPIGSHRHSAPDRKVRRNCSRSKATVNRSLCAGFALPAS